jgi:hypothetical protein
MLALVSGFGDHDYVPKSVRNDFPWCHLKPIDELNAWVRVHLACMPETEDPIVGRFVALVRDVARVRCLLP